MKDKYNPIIYRFLYYAIFTGDALFSPFYIQFFRSIGFNDGQIAILVAIVPFSLFAGDLFFSHFATSFKRSLTIMRITSILEVVSLVCFGLLKAFWPLFALTIIANFFNSSYFQIQDGTCTLAMKKAGKGFESVRIFGSIAYAVALIGGFFIVGVIPYSVLYTIAASFFLVGFVLTFLIVPVADTIPERVVPEESSKADKGLFTNPNFIFFLLFNTLFYASANTVGTLLTLDVTNAGLQDNEYSLWYGIRVVAEIASLSVFPFLFRRFLKSHKKSLILSCILFFASGIIGIFVTDPYALVSSTFLIRGFANGFALISGVLLVHEIVGDKHVTRAIVISAAFSNLFSGLGYLAGVYLSGSWGFPLLFTIFSALSLVGFLFLFFIAEPKRTPQEEAAPEF